LKKFFILLFIEFLTSSSVIYQNPKYKYFNYEKEIQSLTRYDFPELNLFQSIEIPSFIEPLKVDYGISSGFGIRNQVIKGMGGEDGDFHRGIDIVAKEGTEIIASANGTVYMYYPAPDKYFKGHPVFGGLIILSHGNGIYTLYGHLNKTYVKSKQFIKQGQIIGIIGNTGLSTGTHLHFEIMFNPTELFF